MVQRTYGKQAENHGAAVDIFVKVMKAYEPARVIQAIKQWILTSPEYPTPADIIGILDPKPKLDRVVYMAISDRLKRGDKITGQEREYLKLYESDVMKGL